MFLYLLLVVYAGSAAAHLYIIDDVVGLVQIWQESRSDLIVPFVPVVNTVILVRFVLGI